MLNTGIKIYWFIIRKLILKKLTFLLSLDSNSINKALHDNLCNFGVGKYVYSRFVHFVCKLFTSVGKKYENLIKLSLFSKVWCFTWLGLFLEFSLWKWISTYLWNIIFWIIIILSIIMPYFKQKSPHQIIISSKDGSLWCSTSVWFS